VQHGIVAVRDLAGAVADLVGREHVVRGEHLVDKGVACYVHASEFGRT